jgi:hypothetical protein
MVGTYYYPVGFVDALQVLSSPYNYQIAMCRPRNTKFVKLFSSIQNYEILLSQNPKMIAQTIKNNPVVK